MGGWTPEQRAAAAQRCRDKKPWTKSTGPKTDRGKYISCHNALKHGRYDAGSREDRRVLSQILRDTRALIAYGRAWLKWQKQQDKIRKLQNELLTHFRHCEEVSGSDSDPNDEAIQNLDDELDCFASLAMTAQPF